ncbi:hypothetical protein EDC04DRAFT_2728031 [Pisolithus marmoratus]|nr:hypothetical protein EDC04DRAFT_2728031 [Pisolithus marmoratus]
MFMSSVAILSVCMCVPSLLLLSWLDDIGAMGFLVALAIISASSAGIARNQAAKSYLSCTYVR